MARHRYFTADIFTDTPFGGNQLAVFPDARGIPEQRLQDVTREFNYAETTFVFPPKDAKHTRHVRIFTPGAEVPFAGHPTVGTAHVLAAIGEIPLAGDETRIVFEEGVGPVPVMIRSVNGAPAFAQLSVAKMPERGPPAPDVAQLATMLGLREDDFREDAWLPRAYSVGLPFLFVPLKTREAVTRARMRTDLWESVLAGKWAQDVYVFAPGGERDGTDFHARSFVPGFSVPEDPATGSACGALAGYLSARDPRREGTLRWTVEQGFAMGRPSMLYVEADVAGGAVKGVRVGGSSVMVCEGTMEIPD